MNARCSGAGRPKGEAGGERLKRRLVSLDRARDDCALYFNFSRVPQFCRGDFLRLAREAFLKQTGSVQFDRFVLDNGDMVLIGRADLPDRIDTPLARLSELAGGDEPDEATTPLISYFDLTFPDDLDSLTTTVAACTEGPAPAAKRPFTPTDVASICEHMTRHGVADLIRTQTAIALGASTSKPLFQEVFVAMADLQRTVAADIEVSGRPLFRYLMEALDRCVLKHLPSLPSLRADLPLSINLALNTLSSAEFSAFRNANPCRPPLFVEIQIVDVLSAPAAFDTLRPRLAGAGIMLQIDGIPLSALDHVDLATLRPAQVKVFWDQQKDSSALKQRTLALRRAAEQIGRENIILCRIDSETAIACALGAGVTRMQGRLVERLAKATGA